MTIARVSCYDSSMTTVRAITFDLWDTLVDDDSDEAKRTELGLRTKYAQRRHLLYEALSSIEPIEPQVVNQAFDVADAAFNQVWHSQHVTWTVRQRIEVILKVLKLTLPDQVYDQLIEDLEKMEVDKKIPPNLIAGCDQALAQLASQFRLAIVSDAIVTPGRLLRELLENHGVRKHFNAFAFSDEVGHSKPHSSMFESVAQQLGVNVDEMLHIGDREHNDVRGAHAQGMKAVLFTATRDDDRQGTEADAVCDSYDQLPGIIQELTEREN